MPKHPYASLLKEYKIAIEHLTPTVPGEIKKEAEETLARLETNPNATEEEIRAALFKTGTAEYPHRHAFQEWGGEKEPERRLALVLEHVDETVRAKLTKHLDAGVPLAELLKSHLFETEFTPEERHQVEDGILDGDYVFVKKTPSARSGEIVVAMIEGEATVKRYFPERDHVRFQPANANMQPILVLKSDFKQVDIIGIVVGVYRKL